MKEAAMPDAWSNKDERKYEHIKESAKESGKSTDRAEEIAARTVNKGRREEGRTPNRSTQGTGNPNRSYEDRSVEELRNLAAERNVECRSSMKKDELIRALRRK
jgi:plasmid stabilization system protein ParE